MPALLLSAEQRWLICSSVDSQRYFDEELNGLGFQLKEWPWHWNRAEYLADLAQGKSLACDRPFAETRFAGDALVRLRRMLSPRDQACFRSLGRAVGHALEATCRTMSRGQSEEEVAGQVSHRLLHRGVRPVSLSVVADGRSFRYRRGGYTTTPVQCYCIVSATAERYGLYATASRSVCFGPPSPELVNAVEAVCKVTATYIAASVPKGVVRDILATGRRVYALCGFEHEWHCAAQGHLTGRLPVEMLFTPTMLELLQPGTAVTWQASIGAAASCDTILVAEQEPELITASELWPLKTLRAYGKEVLRPSLLVRPPGG
jgi:Xaa-Pro aminopeptidase